MNILAQARAAAGQTYALAEQYLNPHWVGVLRLLGLDNDYCRAQGSYLYDAEGRAYLDLHTGEGVASLGHNHPQIKQALIEGLSSDLPDGIQIHYGALSGLLAKALSERLPEGLNAVFFTNSGTETVEVALKFARAATRRPRLLSCHEGYHGLSYGSLSVCGEAFFKDGFGPLLPGCAQIPFGDLVALDRELQKRDVAAFICEPIQGRRVTIPSDDYFPEAQRLCRKHGTLFVLDEIQTGLGRTGKMFAFEHWNLDPDMVLIAKALSGGFVPVGAMITRRRIYAKVLDSLERSYVHHSTYGRNRLAMIAGLATLRVLDDEQILAQVNEVGGHLLAGLERMAAQYELVKEVRGMGLMLAIEFGPPRALGMRLNWELIHAAADGLFAQLVVIPLLRDHQIISMVSGKNDVIKFLPPLTLSLSEANQFLTALDAVLAACHQSNSQHWKVVLDLAKATVKHKLAWKKKD